MSTAVYDPQLTFTASAAAKVRQIVEAEGRADPMLRVYVQGGGCSGFQYGFEFADGPQDGDFSIETDGVTLVIDPMSLPYLEGAVVDFVNNLAGSQFVVRNPNAKTTCGCGSSFSV